jgi:TrmH family RNA methyltransferase
MKEITSLQHPLVKHLVKLRQSRSYRYEHSEAVIEGRKLIAEIDTKCVIATKVPDGVTTGEIILASKEVIEKISGQKNSEGIVACVQIPPPHEWTKLKKLIVLDGIADPGNLGTLFRTAQAFNWDGLFLLNSCCDPFNEKALSSARGSTFKIPFKQGSFTELQSLAETFNLKGYAADIEGKNFTSIEDNCLFLVLGNEANGLSQEVIDSCEKITIPISNKMESLNVAVAGGILMQSMGFDS